jgi:hypothetical protein
MKVKLSFYPMGGSYIDISESCNSSWHEFPNWAKIFFTQLTISEVKKISPSNVIDSHWYEFDWEGNHYRLIYEEWPRQVVIESCTDGLDLEALLLALSPI